MLGHFNVEKCDTANVKEITGMYQSWIANTIMNVCQFQVFGRTHVVGAFTTKVVNIVILGQNGQNDCDERIYERNKEKKTTDTVLSVC